MNKTSNQPEQPHPADAGGLTAEERIQAIITSARDAAHKLGYAIAVHGSLARDIDLLACPWTEDAASPEALVEAVRVAVDGHWCGGLNLDGTSYAADEKRPTHKPWGRLAWSIGLPHHAPLRFVDLSVMPPVKVRLDSGGESYMLPLDRYLQHMRDDHQIATDRITASFAHAGKQ